MVRVFTAFPHSTLFCTAYTYFAFQLLTSVYVCCVCSLCVSSAEAYGVLPMSFAFFVFYNKLVGASDTQPPTHGRQLHSLLCFTHSHLRRAGRQPHVNLRFSDSQLRTVGGPRAQLAPAVLRACIA